MKKVLKFLLKNHKHLLDIFVLLDKNDVRGLIIYLTNWTIELIQEETNKEQSVRTKIDELIETKTLSVEEIRDKVK